MSNVSLEPAPFCSACGYDLSKSTESSKCPECGRPLVEVLVRDEGAQAARRRYQSEQTFLGLPLVSVAFGRDANGKPGHAKGWLAIGGMVIAAHGVGGLVVGGKGLPFNVNIRSLMAIMLYVSLGIGVVSALPGTIGALTMRGASKRNRN